MPVVPAVYSTTVPPGGSLPSAAARSTMARATRSFMLPVGLADSSLATTRAEAGGTTRRSSTDRKSTRLNSSHSQISYAVFCLKKKRWALDLKIIVLHTSVSQIPLEVVYVQDHEIYGSGILVALGSLNDWASDTRPLNAEHQHTC